MHDILRTNEQVKLMNWQREREKIKITQHRVSS